MTEAEIIEELRKIRKETKISSFDTIYTSILVLGLSIIVSLIIGQWKPDFLIYFLGIGFLLSLLFQFFSIFFPQLKEPSIWIALGFFLQVIVVLSFVVFPVSNNSIFSMRNIITGVLFLFSWFTIFLLFRSFFEKIILNEICVPSLKRF